MFFSLFKIIIFMIFVFCLVVCYLFVLFLLCCQVMLCFVCFISFARFFCDRNASPLCFVLLMFVSVWVECFFCFLHRLFVCFWLLLQIVVRLRVGWVSLLSFCLCVLSCSMSVPLFVCLFARAFVRWTLCDGSFVCFVLVMFFCVVVFCCFLFDDLFCRCFVGPAAFSTLTISIKPKTQ